MLENAIKDLSKYRFEKAELMLKASKISCEQEDWCSANNRAYYCFFHAMRSVLALEKTDFKKHSGVISYFNQHYVATNLFDRSYGAKFANAFTIRNHSDYDDYYLFSKEETVELINDAAEFLDDVRSFLSEKGVL